MFRAILFFFLLIPLTVYYSWLQSRMDENCTSEEQNVPGKKWARTLLNIAGVKIDADLSGIDPHGHYVFIANHQSLVDIPVLFKLLWDNNIRFVAKKSLFDVPVYGTALGTAGHICVDRSNRRAAMKSLGEAVERIKNGISPLIFPEGTRNENLDKLMEFKTGGMIIALKSGLPVVPIVLANTGNVLPKGKLWVRNKNVVRVKALPAIDPSAYTLKERDKLKEDLYSMMNEEYRKMMAEVNNG
ncbi:lysophospholipid acyltransferase family protein [Pseudodesulfovibrio senegalensis]|uniref:1-acyl-sn-glycerol-3-phosphate acyltransferase n=1 Tax=Pseudodesulfovibrio senegalensis TaxID=1721087 RepID=A0A6N6N2Y6_9BACT|nr:lysophospholipid acyltransferase family protein [Pseudodesulfovibrio senegalensis]KAB1442399.1 1-acyl-sn-glycerol-3-phosphate acyltransferase [Pseudodesulfovibrio senegalensis]